MADTTSESRESFRNLEAAQDQFRCMLDHAVFAPSGHNTQPWLFRLGADHLDLIADRTRGLPVVDPYDRELTISCGAALDHLVTAGRHYGKKVTVEVSPDSTDADLLARCRITDEVTPSASDNALFESIPHRRTTRTKFENRELPEDVSERCIELAEQLGVELTLITDSAERSEIADLVAEGDRIQFADPRFRRELASWVHSRRGSSHDGMSGTGFGMPDFLSPIGALVIRTFDLGNGVAAGDQEKIVEGSPTLAVFSSPSDTLPHWLATGQALSRVLLALTDAGATASYLNPPVELEELRPRLRELIQCKGTPQLLMRFGYGPSAAPTVRREVDDVLIS